MFICCSTIKHQRRLDIFFVQGKVSRFFGNYHEIFVDVLEFNVNPWETKIKALIDWFTRKFLQHCKWPFSREGSFSCHTCCDTGAWRWSDRTIVRHVDSPTLFLNIAKKWKIVLCCWNTVYSMYFNVHERLSDYGAVGLAIGSHVTRVLSFCVLPEGCSILLPLGYTTTRVTEKLF